MDDETSTKLALLQPTRQRKWELRHGDELVAELTLPAVQRGGRGKIGERELELRVRGLFKREHVVVDTSTEAEVARVRGHTVEFRGVESAEWTSLGRGAGHGLVGAEGEAWLRAKVSSSTFRTTGQIEIAAGHEVSVPALVAAYLLIRHAEDVAAATAANVAAT